MRLFLAFTCFCFLFCFSSAIPVNRFFKAGKTVQRLTSAFSVAGKVPKGLGENEIQMLDSSPLPAGQEGKKVQPPSSAILGSKVPKEQGKIQFAHPLVTCAPIQVSAKSKSADSIYADYFHALREGDIVYPKGFVSKDEALKDKQSRNPPMAVIAPPIEMGDETLTIVSVGMASLQGVTVIVAPVLEPGFGRDDVVHWDLNKDVRVDRSKPVELPVTGPIPCRRGFKIQ